MLKHLDNALTAYIFDCNKSRTNRRLEPNSWADAKKCRLRKPASQAKRTGFSPFNERNAGLLRKLVEELHDRADIDGGEML